MQIAGLQKTSLLDYPGKVSAIIFTQGCPFRCGFCHNPELLAAVGLQVLPTEEILDWLAKRKKVLDGVVITGGEPTVQADLFSFIKKLKTLGYLVKLDTNGANPEALEKLLGAKLLDYIAMDIKAPLEKYDLVTSVKINKTKIKKSIKLIMASGLPYEFRSTILPKYHTEEDVVAMAKLISGAPKYFLQKFVSQGKLQDPCLADEKPFSDSQMEALAKKCLTFVGSCEAR